MNGATYNPTSRRAGVALVLVLGLVAAVAVLGLAYIEANGIGVQGSFNLVNNSRARYVAESGVEHAIHWLGHPNPPNANADGYWPGAACQLVDDSADYYDVTVIRDEDDHDLFQIVSTGHQVGAPGLAHRVSVRARTTASQTLTLLHGLHLEAYNWLSARYTINGDVHGNDSLTVSAAVHGNVTATGFALPLVQLLGSILGHQPDSVFPSLTWQSYVSYVLGGSQCSAVVYNSRQLDTSFKNDDPTGQHRLTWHISATNPGGVLNATHRKEDIRIHDDVNFTGTIAIDGDVVFLGDDITLNAVPGFPALVVNGNIILQGRNKNITINGAVLCTGTLTNNGNDVRYSTLAINGPAHFGQALASLPSNYGGVTINYSASTAWLYNFTGSDGDEGTGQVTVESWSDR